jgi:hypothetical protein
LPRHGFAAAQFYQDIQRIHTILLAETLGVKKEGGVHTCVPDRNRIAIRDGLERHDGSDDKLGRVE